MHKIEIVKILFPKSMYSSLPSSLAFSNICPPNAAYTVALGNQAQAINNFSPQQYFF